MKSTLSGWFRDGTVDDIVAFSKVEQLNPVDYGKLTRRFRSFGEFDVAGITELISAGLTPHQAESIKNRNRDVSIERRLMDLRGINIVTHGDRLYPSLLGQLPDPPLWLYFRGRLAQEWSRSVSVVGARKPSSYTQACLELVFPAPLTKQLTTVSGLAYGVDALVHRHSLTTGGPTIAVLAGGLDSIYPSENQQLAEEIVARGGLLLSEYPPFCRPQPYRFPIRNRIVAGLSRATVILEAKMKSGTMTTAAAAIDYNRELFVVPGRITDESSAGGHFLIKSGAMLLDGPEQIADYYNLELERGVAKTHPSLDTPEGKLLHLLTDRSLSLDELVARTGQSVENILGLITRLELSGELFQDGAGRYSAKK